MCTLSFLPLLPLALKGEENVPHFPDEAFTVKQQASGDTPTLPPTPTPGFLPFRRLRASGLNAQTRRPLDSCIPPLSQQLLVECWL